MGIKTYSLELSFCWELAAPAASVDRGLSTDGDDEEEADEGLVEACGKVCFVGFVQRSRIIRLLLSAVRLLVWE